MRILALLTDGYGCLGGIAQYNRDFIAALNASPRVESIVAWPRHIKEPIIEEIPEAVIYERSFAGGKWRFVYAAIRALLVSRPCDLVICGHLHLLPIGWLAAKRRGAVLALCIHGVEAWSPTKNILTNFLARQADHLISVSRFSDDRFRAWALPAAGTTLIPPCVDLDRFKPGEKPAALAARYGVEGHRTLMTMGRLAASEQYKGVDEVLELLPDIVTDFPDLRYVIVGDGDDRQRLAQKAVALGVSQHTVFTGWIKEDEKADHFRLADIFVLPSRGEGFGIVLIEAAASGAVVIGSAVDGAREALLDGALGMLIDPAKPAQLRDALATALSSTPTRARKAAIETFSRKAFEKRVADWLERIAVTG